jgi:DNA-binding MurR/RpiR family transcriptional regulator
MIRYNNKIVSKLTFAQVAELRSTRPATGRTEWYEQQAKRLGVSSSAIIRACNAVAWGGVCRG